jgi:hypothetical protein
MCVPLSVFAAELELLPRSRFSSCAYELSVTNKIATNTSARPRLSERRENNRRAPCQEFCERCHPHPREGQQMSS